MSPGFVVGQVGSIVRLVADIDMLTNTFFSLREQGEIEELGISFDFDNVTFVLNVLDKLAGEPVDLFVRGKLFAQGEVVVVEESFGVRVIVDGAWGFASSGHMNSPEADRIAAPAVHIARAPARHNAKPVVLDDRAPARGHYETPLQEDPFDRYA